MTKSISIYDNRSLSELQWGENEPLAFMDDKEEIYFSVADKILKEKFKDYGLELTLNFKDNVEEWTLYPKGKVMLLKSPTIDESKRIYIVPDVRYLSPLDYGKNRPSPNIKKACAGKDEIKKMIEESQNMRYYLFDLRKGNLVLGRTDLMNFLANFGLEAILPNPVRFKGF